MVLRSWLAAVSFAVVISPAALAQTEAKPAQARTGAQLRIDSVGAKTQVEGKTTAQSQSLNLATARFGLTGDLAEQLSYTLRLNLRSAANFGADRNTPDGGLAALDRAYIEHRLIPNLALKIGRMPMFAGSIEADYSSIDQYIYSYVSDSVVKITPITSGFDLTYTFGTQSISLDAFNGFYDGNTEKKGAEQGENMSYGIGYRGNFAGGMVKPIISYDRFSRIRNGVGATRDDKAVYTAYAVGTQVSVAGADIDLEYDALNKPKFDLFLLDDKKATYGTTYLEQKTSGIIAQVAFNATAVHLRPFIKTTADTEKTDGEQTYKAARSALGVEYRPGPKGFRYHVVATDLKDDATKFDAVTSKAKTTQTKTRQYIVGVAAKM